MRISIADLTDQLSDPASSWRWHRPSFGACCDKQTENPAKTHLLLITDLYEGGDAKSMMARAATIKQSGVNLIVLLALSDSGHAAYEAKHAERIASRCCPVLRISFRR
jgi:VWA domain containing CoxE-like protein